MTATTQRYPAATRRAAQADMVSVDWAWREWLTPAKVGWLLLALLLMVAAATKDLWAAAFDHELTAVKVQGEFKYLSSTQMEVQAQRWLGGGFLTVNLNQIKYEIEQEPWVSQAVVSRRWPGSLMIVVIEQTPIAYWGEGALLNERGQLFTPQAMVNDLNLPRLQAPDLDSDLARLEVFETWQRLQPKFEAFGVQPLSLTQSARGAWEVELEGGISIALGTGDMDAKIERLGRVLSNLSTDDLTRILRIDLRYPNGAAVKWRS